MNSFSMEVVNAEIGETYLFSIGQAGYIIKSKNGQLLGIDMYLSDCVERFEGHIGFKRLLPKILCPFELEFDYLITTHKHFDHFDIDSIPQMISRKKTKLYASIDCEILVKRLFMDNESINYVKPGNKYIAGDFILDFVNCDHGRDNPNAVGVVITVDYKKIYITGDTCLRIDRLDEYISKGPFDIMIAPINGAYGNMNERDCAELSGALNPKFIIPSHYGMFASHGGDPGCFLKIINEKHSKIKCILMTQGEKVTL